MTKTVYVVMGNDYPAGAFSTQAKAANYCEKRRAKDKADAERRGEKDYGSPRIYWRVYPYELDAEGGL